MYWNYVCQLLIHSHLCAQVILIIMIISVWKWAVTTFLANSVLLPATNVNYALLPKRKLADISVHALISANYCIYALLPIKKKISALKFMKLRGAQVRMRTFTFIVEVADNPQMTMAKGSSRVYASLPVSFCQKTEL